MTNRKRYDNLLVKHYDELVNFIKYLFRMDGIQQGTLLEEMCDKLELNLYGDAIFKKVDFSKTDKQIIGYIKRGLHYKKSNVMTYYNTRKRKSHWVTKIVDQETMDSFPQQYKKK